MFKDLQPDEFSINDIYDTILNLTKIIDTLPCKPIDFKASKCSVITTVQYKLGNAFAFFGKL